VRQLIPFALALVLAPLSSVLHSSAQSSATKRQPPKLLVFIVVDQMRADYVDRFQKDWTGGLKRLVSDGAVFTSAAYPYLTTTTCAGHATIATGSYPRSHGIIQNQWWDRARGALITCTEDPRATGIGYRGPIKNGDSAWRQQRPTLTDVVRTQRHGRIVTLSVKDRSAVMLAGHGGDAVTWISDSLEGWMTSSAYAEGPLPAVTSFVEAHPIAEDFGKIWTLTLPATDYPEADDVASEAPPRGWTRTFPHPLNGAANAPDATFLAQWQRSPFSSAYLSRFAIALSDAFELGRRDTTDVLGVSYSGPDLLGHAFGPDSLEQHDNFIQLDRAIGALFDHLDATVGRGRWTAALSADHGVTPVPERLVAAGKDAGRINGAALRAAVEERLRTALGVDRPYVTVVNTNDFYFAPGVYEKLKNSPKILESVLQAIREQPGVARVFRGEELRDPRDDDPLQHAAALSYFPGRSGDLVIAPKPGWMFSAAGTTHGNATPDDQRVPLVFLGAGIKPGHYADAATPADISPTLAAVAGVKMPKTDGHVLISALGH
jgi:predicted AlkP superfamily pyrophosphatase or phosphodiesterase